MRPFDKEHRAFLKALNKYLVKYVIIGGHASIYHGVNRNTGDLDILIEPTVENGHSLLNALKSLKLEVPEINDEEWTSQLVLSFGFEPDAIDILNYAPGLTFNDVYKNSIQTEQEGVEISMIDIRDLIKNKEALNRTGEKSHLDKYDLDVLKKIIEKRK
jgi:predicted nucleotidyltransferase